MKDIRSRLNTEISVFNFIEKQSSIQFDRTRAAKFKSRYALLRSLLDLKVINKTQLSLYLLDHPKNKLGANSNADQ